jgi:hypothetical protein
MKIVRSLLAAVGMLQLCACSPCENEVTQSVLAPSGRLKAVVFNRGCGATVGFNTQVSIIEAGRDLPNDGGNVLITDDKVDLSLQWTSDKALTIFGPLAGRAFKKESELPGVQISYR